MIDPASLRIVSVVTTPDRRQNLIFCECPPVGEAGPFSHDAEVSEVVVINEPVATAFPLHTEQVRAFSNGAVALEQAESAKWRRNGPKERV